jgi:hypothetical protein
VVGAHFTANNANSGSLNGNFGSADSVSASAAAGVRRAVPSNVCFARNLDLDRANPGLTARALGHAALTGCPFTTKHQNDQGLEGPVAVRAGAVC